MDIESMYIEYFPKIYNYVFFKILHKEQTEEIVSIVFLKVIEKIDIFDETKASFATWIYRIAQNSLIDYYRTRRDQVPIDENKDVLPPVDFKGEMELIKNETRKEVYKALCELDAKTREIISMRYFGEMTVREISKALSMNESTVSSVHVRGLKKLKSLLGKDYFI